MTHHPAARANLTALGGGHFRLSGAVSFGTVMPLLEKSDELFRSEPDITIDFSDVERFNSAGLAMLIEWLRWARIGKRDLRFERLPEAALAMARICDVEPFLAPALEGNRRAQPPSSPAGKS
ncbi:MAG: STAS domain-containing protein [Gammaproteobacteria bacterium]|nr:STAS domain-containing protein [Gammaproteobacteria bacterium]